MRTVLILLLCLTALTALAARDALFNEQGLRAERYQGTTPQSVPNGQLIGTEELAVKLAQNAPVLIDVQAVTVRPETRDFGFAWLPTKPRYSLPGAVWLPNVGYGSLDEDMDAFFRRELMRLTGGDKARPLVIFCVLNCWMSWNAVQRAYDYGYRNIYWYREGTDGWEASGRETFVVEPEPLYADS